MTNKLKRTLSLVLALYMTLGLVTTGALAETEPGSVQNENPEPVCAELEGCTGEAHDEECPLYTAPDNSADDEPDSSVEETPEVPAEDQDSIGADVSDVVEDELISPSNAALAPQVETVETHIATYVGQAPDGLTGDFSIPYSTVKATADDGTEYTVEVVPEGLVYFIDQIDFNSGTVSAPYNAVAALVGSGLLNDKYDQQSNGTWGLVGDYKVKDISNVNIENKDETGLYGATEAGGTLVYSLLLEAGSYTITSMHHEWWGQTRSMETSIQAGGIELGTDTVQLSKDSQLSEISFELSQDGTVTYTVRSTGNNAPVISWLAVEKTGEYEAPDDSIVASGDCGDQGGNVTWTLTKDGTLTISGNGAMVDYGDYAVPWKNYRSATAENAITSIVIDEGVTRIGNNAFYFCQGVTGSVTIPEGVTSIGYRAFYEAKFITGIELPGTLERLENQVFNGCRGITSLVLPESLNYIGQSAFDYCVGLESLMIPDGVTSLTKTPVKHCTNLKYITISNNVTSISDIGLTDCPNLTTIKLGSKTVAVSRNFVDIPNVILTAESLNALVERNSNYITNYFSASNTYYLIGDSVAAETLALLPEGAVIKV